MKKLAILAAAIMLLSLVGCGSAGEVQRRIVVHAIGIDAAPEGYSVSYQIFSGKAPDGVAPVDADESTVVTLTAQGKNLRETEESLRLQTGKEVFLGDAELVVIGESVPAGDILEFLNYFRDSDIYLGVSVVWCEGSAAETVGVKLRQGGATAILLRGVIDEAREVSKALSSRIIELTNALEQDGETPAIPILTLDKRDSHGDGYTLTDTTIGVFGSALVSPGGERQDISVRAATGLSLLRAEAKKLTLSLGEGEKAASAEIDRLKITRGLEIVGGLPEVRLHISGRYKINYLPAGIKEEEVRLAAQREILSLCSEAADTLFFGDTAEITKLVMKYEPAYFTARGESFSEIIPKTAFSVDVRLRKY